MNKKLVIAFLLTLTMGALYAAPVSADMARRIAVNFWNTYYTENQKPVSDMQLRTYNELRHMYVFTNDDQGFVIVAADDCVRPVLGYSFDSPFPEELNPELRYWLTGIDQQVEAATSTDRAANFRWSRLMQSAPSVPISLQNVPQLCQTRWDQGEPYNRKCPYDSTYHTRCVVGCVATAMAQIMKRWNFPSCGTGSRSYAYASYGVLSADFAHTTYRWDQMPDYVNFAVTPEESDALSTLSYHCGVAVDMMYGPSATGGSGAYSQCGSWATTCATNAFYTYFKYKPTLRFRNRSNFNDSIWLSMIDVELAAERPIYYSGRDYEGGHAFVLDGSNLDTMYHFNWGWSGYGDGYYTMDNLAPGSGGAGGNATYTFNLDQGAIFGIEPGEEILDTIHVYDTFCVSYGEYEFHGFTLPNATCDTQLRYLDTVFFLHLTRLDYKSLSFRPNGAEGNLFSQQYCPADSVLMPECPFVHPDTNLRFCGWCRNPYGNGDVYRAGESYRLTFNATLFAVWVDKNLGIAEAQGDDLVIWPNPTKDKINFSITTADDITVNVIDAWGRLVIQRKVVGDKAKISLERLPAGSYTVMVYTADAVYKKQIIKK